MKISIAMVTHDMVPASFMFDLANLCAFTVANLPDDVEFGLNMVAGTYVHTGRQELLQKLLADGATHILWLDTDMRFPRDAFFRLQQHNKPIVGINYSTRGIPADWVAIKRVSTELDPKGERCATYPDSTGLEEVEAIGFGMVLMRRDAVENLPSLGETPWFGFRWKANHQQWVGEDVWFCDLLRKAGQTIYVDHDTSKLCKHVGQFEYDLQHVLACKEAEVA